MRDKILLAAINHGLKELEEANEIVVCSVSHDKAANHLHDVVSEVTPRTNLSLEELQAVRSLIYFAINDTRFFDWEMPTLTGKKAEEFRNIAEKLPAP